MAGGVHESDAIGRRACAAAARCGQKDLQLTQVHAQALERQLIGFIDHYERYYLIFYFMTSAYYQIHGGNKARLRALQA